jgi:tetratricopeptide (TPR) repeat protein
MVLVKNILPLVSLLLIASAPSTFAAETDVCRQLVTSLSFPTEGDGRQEAFFKDAEKAYHDCRDSKLPADVRARALVKYGVASDLRGYGQTAISAFREAVETLDRFPGDQTGLLIEVLDHATALETAARLRADAMAHANRALSLRRAKFGDQSAEAVTGMVNLAVAQATFGDYKASEMLLRTAVRTAERTCGPECDALADAYSGMAALYAAEGNEAEAKKYAEMSANANPPRTRISPRKE